MKESGVYEIVNLVNGRRYVGSAVDFGKRWYMHRWQLRQGVHSNRHLQASWLKHGESNFEFRRLIICTREQATMYEQIAMSALHPEFNKAPVAGSTLGVKFSQETREKLSRSKAASNLSPETRARMSASQSRRRHTPETKAKLSEIFSGRFVSEETRAKMSAAGMGHRVSAETRAKLAAASSGRKHSPEAIAKCSAASTGRRHTEEAKAKISAAAKARAAARLDSK